VGVRYESWKGVVERTLEPLGLVLKAGVWYMAAASGNDARTYRLSNVLALHDTGETFERPKGFDLAAYWQASTRRFEAELYRGSAVIRATERGCKLLRGLSAALADAVDAAGPSRAAWRELTIPIESVEHAAGQLLRLGAEVQVLEPPALRRRIGDTAAAIAALYAVPPPRRVKPRR
jgi:predicted DNA-binding transcriptional regulator YafY